MDFLDSPLRGVPCAAGRGAYGQPQALVTPTVAKAPLSSAQLFHGRRQRLLLLPVAGIANPPIDLPLIRWILTPVATKNPVAPAKLPV
jgi:hypothetical protein